MKYKLGDIVKEVIDYRGKTPKKLGFDWADSGIRALSAKNIKTGEIVQPESIRYVSEENYPKWMKQEVERGTILVTSEAPFGQVLYWDSDEKIVLSQRLFAVKIKDEFDSKYVYYQMISDEFQNEMRARATGSTVTGLRQPELLKCKIEVPDLKTQQKTVRILSALDQKIDLNNKINATNKELIKTIYNRYFNSFQDYCRLDEISTVTIGKTPPRNNHECFTKNNDDIKWVSISDLGKSGLYIWDTSEKLTRDAVNQYGVKTVPKDTLVLSFKLTIGRTGITTEEMATNEAIAHIIPNDDKMKHYLYCTLSFYNYNELGSTSSIANAINSKIVKSMKIGIPNTETITKFNKVTKPLFESIKNNELENNTLIELRDVLLSKLMSGETNLDKVAL